MRRVLFAALTVLALSSTSLAIGPYSRQVNAIRHSMPAHSYNYGPSYGYPSTPYGGAGGYGANYGGFGYYQPWSTMYYPNPYGGAYTVNGGMIGPWGYMPFSYTMPAYPAYGGFGVY